MGFHDYISESEATGITGVSSATLKRFSEAGYISIESDSDGLRLYCRDELEQVFGLAQFSKTAEELSGEVKETKSIAADKEEPRETPTVERNYWSNAIDQEDGESTPEEEPATESATAAETETEIENIAESLDFDTSNEVFSASTTARSNEPAAIQQAKESSASDSQLEIVRLEKLVNMLEELLDAKHGELEEVREERNWLRKRIEKLEEKADRDQLLLLSEAQIVRRLVEQQNSPKKSGLRSALEWFGFVSPQPPMAISQTIDGLNTPASERTVSRSEAAPSQGSDVANGSSSKIRSAA